MSIHDPITRYPTDSAPMPLWVQREAQERMSRFGRRLDAGDRLETFRADFDRALIAAKEAEYAEASAMFGMAIATQARYLRRLTSRPSGSADAK